MKSRCKRVDLENLNYVKTIHTPLFQPPQCLEDANQENLPTGIYHLNSLTKNLPPGINFQGGNLINLNFNVESAQQIAIPRTANVMVIRTLAGTYPNLPWANWVKVVTESV